MKRVANHQKVQKQVFRSAHKGETPWVGLEQLVEDMEYKARHKCEVSSEEILARSPANHTKKKAVPLPPLRKHRQTTAVH